MRYLLLSVITLALAVPAQAAIPRSSKVRADFARAYPCPATGERNPSCPGWRIDHVHSLCAGGPDAVNNLQWLTVEEWARKARVEKQYCAWLRKGRKAAAERSGA